MEFCQSHWDQLRQAIDNRCLSHLVAKNGEDATKRLEAELEGNHDIKNYDPLIDAHNMIITRALEEGGLYLLERNYCPLCELVKNDGDDDEWINGCTSAIRKYCEENKLVALTQ